MRHLIAAILTLSLAACALFEPASKRYVVFFKPNSTDLMESADSVIGAAAEWAKSHPDKPITIAAFTDTHGTPESNADLARARAQAVFESLVHFGVPATHIARREVGPVQYQLDSQESRRVVVTIGKTEG